MVSAAPIPVDDKDACTVSSNAWLCPVTKAVLVNPSRCSRRDFVNSSVRMENVASDSLNSLSY